MKSSVFAKGFAALLLTSGLTACAGSTQSDGSVMGESLSMLRGLWSGDEDASENRLTPTAGFPGIDPGVIQGVDRSLLGVYVESHENLAGLGAVESGGGRVHWRTLDNVEIVTSSRGMVLATRGLGKDLQAADASQTEALIAAGRSGRAERRHVYLDGIYAAEDLRMSCQVERGAEQAISVNNRVHRVIRFDETCSGAEETIHNSYWRDVASPGIIRQSSQWVGAELGHFYLQRLVD